MRPSTKSAGIRFATQAEQAIYGFRSGRFDAHAAIALRSGRGGIWAWLRTCPLPAR